VQKVCIPLQDEKVAADRRMARQVVNFAARRRFGLSVQPISLQRCLGRRWSRPGV
jgi:hypothetical protein